MKNTFVSFFIFTPLLFLPACSNADSEQSKVYSLTQSQFVTKEKNITKKFKLTKVKMSCLIFKKLDEKVANKVIVEVREKHNSECGGDPITSPRLFSIDFNESNDKVWTDAKSLLGQLELLK